MPLFFNTFYASNNPEPLPDSNYKSNKHQLRFRLAEKRVTINRTAKDPDNKQGGWFTLIAAALSATLGICAFTQYDAFINSGSGLGKVKLFKMMVLFIDSVGGRWLVLAALALLTVALVYIGVGQLMKNPKRRS